MNRHPERTEDYLEHILKALDRIQRYSDGKSKADFSGRKQLLASAQMTRRL